MTDERIRLRFHFGGKWEQNPRMQYVGGSSFETGMGFEVDRFSYWDVRRFYCGFLLMNEVSLWFKMDAGGGGNGEIIRMLSDVEVVQMVEMQKAYPITDVYGIEVGLVRANLEQLQKRLDDAKRTDKELDELQIPNEVADENEEEQNDESDSSEDEEENEEEQGEEVGGTVHMDEEENEKEQEVVVQENVEAVVQENVEEAVVQENVEAVVQENVEEVGGENVEEVGRENVEEVGRENAEKIRRENVKEVGRENVNKVGRENVEEAINQQFFEMPDPVILGDTELLGIINESDDDVHIEHPWFNEELAKEGKIVLCKGMKFKSVAIFRQALKDWSIKKGCGYKFMKNNKQRVTANCTETVDHDEEEPAEDLVKCEFRVHASVINDEGVFQIKTWNPNHSCVRNWDNHLVTSRYLSERFLEEFRDNPTWPVIAMQQTFQKRLQASITIQQCYRAKKRALRIIQGEEASQYKRLCDYGSAILTVSPGSTVKIHTRMGCPGYVREQNPGDLFPETVPLPLVPQFQYMYVRYAAQKSAFFSGLRPFVGLDGCFLKGRFGGQLLSAVAKDGNEQLYPLAIAVVDAEDKSSWTWFLSNLISDFGHPRDSKMIFMSDKKKGLQEAMHQLMPGVEHRFCVKHLYENFKATYKGQEYKDLLWAAASTGSIAKWKNYLEEMKKLPMGEEAVKWLMKNEPSTWCRSHFSTDSKTHLIVNNISESFNAAILKGRDMPIVSMLEWIRKNWMKKIHQKRLSMEAYNGRICPNIMKVLDRIKLGAGNCFATPCGPRQFEIEHYGTTSVVDINKRSCTCRMWEIMGIPCKHAVAAIRACRLQPEAFVDAYYSKDTYLGVYSHYIPAMPSKDEWPMTEEEDVNPPLIRKPTGRPKRKRRRQVGEKDIHTTKLSRAGGDVRCGNCKQTGHNIRGCKAAITGESPAQRRYRLAKEKEARKAASSSTSQTKKYKRRKTPQQSQQSQQEQPAVEQN